MRKLFILLFFLSSLYCGQIELTQKELFYLSTKQNVITMCVDPDWEPFEKINRNGIHEGISADIIKIIQKKLNIEIKLIHTKTWDEIIAF